MHCKLMYFITNKLKLQLNSVSVFFEGEMYLQKAEHLPEVSLTAGLMLLSNYQHTTFPALFFFFFFSLLWCYQDDCYLSSCASFSGESSVF